MKMKFTGTQYRGMDGNKTMIVATGQEVEVSDEKSKQLLRDYPSTWAVAGQEVKKEIKPPVTDEKTQAKVDAAIAKLREEANAPKQSEKTEPAKEAAARPRKPVVKAPVRRRK